MGKITANFDNSFAHLPPRFFASVRPTPSSAPRLIALNRGLARLLDLDLATLEGPEGAAILSGNDLPDGAQPLAMAYAGHQFGHFNPQLGDGRAILLGEVIDREGRRRDIQLKGAGITPFSRRGDGRAAMGPVLREYLVSEAMTALGIPSTRALAAVATGDQVYRETSLPGAILTRVAASHLRIGSFQFFAARDDVEALRLLADYAIERHDPAARDAENPYRALLDGVIARQAKLVALWLQIGFVHGVMNTDNMSISGETIDFGPCAFIDHYDPEAVYSAIDEQGRYRFNHQPGIAQWNLTRLAESLLPLLADDEKEAIRLAEEALEQFPTLFEAALSGGFRRKLGLSSEEPLDLTLAQDLLSLMATQQADYTNVFRALSEDPASAALWFRDPRSVAPWLERWQQRLTRETRPATERAALMQSVNPAVIPRNHLIEAVIKAAIEREDYAPFTALLAEVTDPFRKRSKDDPFTLPPTPEQRVWRTFCGT